ncbi:hypothetical protein TAL182_CH02972 [Rhizobium sp. TAL182]|uniref:hypothetical protein n=1 Tax=Rhizobium sp. TAL182 TaxID=2020313 RepID=UPI000A20F520|nr:hypothetical protein [Rhizobium sp. TAL182]ARO24718.1 hypothetical protein TAL182_CH02972 [Rhizobium sp. TAL182]
MLHIYVDTALLAVPNYGYGISGVSQEIIDRMTHFSVLTLEDVPLKIVVSDDAEDVLGVDYPSIESIEEFLNAEGLAHIYSVNDLYKQYLILLDRAARPHELNTFEVYDFSYFSSVPPLPPGLGPARLATETQRVFVSVGAKNESGSTWYVGSSMNAGGVRVYDVTSIVDAASHNPAPVYGPLPFQFTSQVKILENIVDLVDISVAEELWRNASSAEDIHFAVSLGAFALKKSIDQGAAIADLRQFTIGSDFFDSLCGHGCAGTQHYSSTTFELCAQIVADIGIADIRVMGRPVQTRRVRDHAGACRTHINGGGVGLRLMHWDCGPHIEFANVGAKHELYIAPGVSGEETLINLGDVL